MAYGDKRDYPKIDIYVDGNYRTSTTWSRTCREAVAVFKQINPVVASRATSITARFDRR
jgi:hypothetical protein